LVDRDEGNTKSNGISLLLVLVDFLEYGSFLIQQSIYWRNAEPASDCRQSEIASK
jgi:hypothetical protein